MDANFDTSRLGQTFSDHNRGKSSLLFRLFPSSPLAHRWPWCLLDLKQHQCKMWNDPSSALKHLFRWWNSGQNQDLPVVALSLVLSMAPNLPKPYPVKRNVRTLPSSKFRLSWNALRNHCIRTSQIFWLNQQSVWSQLKSVCNILSCLCIYW